MAKFSFFFSSGRLGMARRWLSTTDSMKFMSFCARDSSSADICRGRGGGGGGHANRNVKITQVHPTMPFGDHRHGVSPKCTEASGVAFFFLIVVAFSGLSDCFFFPVFAVAKCRATTCTHGCAEDSLDENPTTRRAKIHAMSDNNIKITKSIDLSEQNFASDHLTIMTTKNHHHQKLELEIIPPTASWLFAG